MFGLLLLLILPVACTTDLHRQWVKVPRREVPIDHDLSLHSLVFETDWRNGNWVAFEIRDGCKHCAGCQLSLFLTEEKFSPVLDCGSATILHQINRTVPVNQWNLRQKEVNTLYLSVNGQDVVKFKPRSSKKKFLQFFVTSADTATTRYRLSSGEWKDVTKVVLDYNIQLYPLEFTTNTAAGTMSRAFVQITLLTDDSIYQRTKEIDFRIDLNRNTFSIQQCMECRGRMNWQDLNNVPTETAKKWKLTKTKHSMELFCNSVHVLSYKYTDSLKVPCMECIPIMGLNHSRVQFNELNDRTSETYLDSPSCTSLPPSWKGVRVIPSLPVPFGSMVDVCCENGYYKASGDYKIKCRGEDRYEFLDQPICRKICEN